MSSYTVVAYPALVLPETFLGLIYARWLKTYRYGNDYLRLVKSKDYFPAYHRYISSILGRPETVVRLALLTEDRDVALGFSVCRGNLLDYVHVDRSQRRMGIGTSLVPKGIDTITHVTRTGLTIWGSHYGHWSFNPFA